MEVKLNEVSGLADAIKTMYLSRRTLTQEIASNIDYVIGKKNSDKPLTDEEVEQYNKWIDLLVKIGYKHITLLRYIDFSFTVTDIHRGAQDDWDSHAKRFENRIVRSSTRLADYGYEMSDYYKDKIIPTDLALEHLGIELPNTFQKDGCTWVKGVNGYIKEEYQNVKDVKRGLYMLSIPSTFIYKINLTEFAHVYKERGNKGTAHPEVKLLAETCADLIQKYEPRFDRDLLTKILN